MIKTKQNPFKKISFKNSSVFLDKILIQFHYVKNKRKYNYYKIYSFFIKV